MKKGAVPQAFWMAVAICSFLFSSQTYATTIYTSFIDTSYLGTTWYNWTGSTGNINFNSSSMSSTLSTLYTQGDVYTLTMTGKLTFQSNLLQDYSSGDGLAKGYFQGGVTVTITGGLKLNGNYVYGGTGTSAKQILAATLQPVHDNPQNPTANQWSFEEAELQAGNFDKTLLLQLVDGSVGLASGILIQGTTDTLVMQSPKMDLSLKSPSVNPNNFVSTSLGTGSTASNVKITGVPEPMTLVLFGIGTLLFRQKNS